VFHFTVGCLLLAVAIYYSGNWRIKPLLALRVAPAYGLFGVDIIYPLAWPIPCGKVAVDGTIT